MILGPKGETGWGVRDTETRVNKFRYGSKRMLVDIDSEFSFKLLTCLRCISRVERRVVWMSGKKSKSPDVEAGRQAGAWSEQKP